MAAFHPSQPLFGPSSHPYGYRGDERSSSASGDTGSHVTLLIRHLPEAIPQDTLSRLLSHYGASAVRPFISGKLRFLGKVLKVDRASNPIKTNEGQILDSQSTKGDRLKSGFQASDDDKNTKISSGLADEPIAYKLGIEYPFPPHLEYAYPPLDGNILTNVVNALIAVPRFYTQVLHLMNKMNIPAPFRMALPTPPLPPSGPAPPPPPPPAPTAVKPSREDLSESESEMESSEEDVDEKIIGSESSKVPRSGRKRSRAEAIVGPAVNKDITHEEVGVKPAALLPKEMPLIKKNNPVLQIKIASKRMKGEQKDDTEARDEDLLEKEETNEAWFATIAELESSKLPREEIMALPQFKNYTAGNPAPVLYIKNLAKDVVPDDFYFIFGSMFGSLDEAKTKLSVKLMQEGRMRGQAFVAFPSVELAQTALNLVHGYKFKGKPMIIQFGRHTAAVKSNPTDTP